MGNRLSKNIIFSGKLARMLPPTFRRNIIERTKFKRTVPSMIDIDLFVTFKEKFDQLSMGELKNEKVLESKKKRETRELRI